MSRIDNTFTTQKLDRPQDTQGLPGATQRTGILDTATLEAVTHIPAPEVQQALDNLRHIPELRQDLLEQVVRRLNNQDLLTPAAATQTADAMLADTEATLLQPPAPATADETLPAAQTDVPAAAVDPLQLQATLRQIPLLRQEVVAEVAQKLANGQLTTP